MHASSRRCWSCLALTALMATTACNDPMRPRHTDPSTSDVGKSQPHRIGSEVQARLPIAARVTAELNTRRCGEPVRVRGKLTLDGLNGRFIFRWREVDAREKSVDVALLPPGQSVVFEALAPSGSGADAPEILVQFLDATGRSLSRPMFAGRCGEAMLPLAAALHLDARARLDVALQGCILDATRASIAGELTLPGLQARILFAEATAGKRALGTEIVLPLLAAGTCLELPKQAAQVPSDAEVFFCFLDSRGQALSLEFPLGRCGSLPF